MLRPRIIPCLLVRNKGLVKTVQFGEGKYVGDPINAVRIFNEKKVDELIVLDIDATQLGEEPDLDLIRKLAAECRMPFCYGGGVKSAEQAKQIIGLGVEKVALSAAAIDRPELVSENATELGSQSVVVVLDVKKKRFGKDYEVWTHNGRKNRRLCPVEFSRTLADLGVVRADLAIRNALVAERRPHDGGEVGDLVAVEAVQLSGGGQRDSCALGKGRSRHSSREGRS